MSRIRNEYTILVLKPDGKKQNEKPVLKREGSIKKKLKDTGCKNMDWIVMAEVYGMHCRRSLGSRDRGFESYSGHGCLVFVCVCAFFCVCVQVEALRRADHPPKEFYRLYKV
jgi:hypothetical protein